MNLTTCQQIILYCLLVQPEVPNGLRKMQARERISRRRRLSADYRKRCREESRIRYRKNPARLIKQEIDYQRTRRRVDEGYRLRHNLSTRLWRAARRDGVRKSNRTAALIGCSIDELRACLEKQFKPGMSWENYGPVWHVDHIKPCVSFDLTKPEQQRECFHFSNLQPLFAEDNLKKGCKIL